jgi:hypothetical protein
MSVTININGLSLIHKDSGGVSSATLPDVCVTPGAGGALVCEQCKGDPAMQAVGEAAVLYKKPKYWGGGAAFQSPRTAALT